MIIGEHQFELIQHFQPVVDISSSEISHYEVLLRGKEPKFNIGDYIEKLERENKIFELDSWNVISLSQKLRNSELGEGRPCAINLSAKTIEDNRFVSVIKDAFEILGRRNAGRLSFEITETAEINNFKTVSDFVDAVKKWGSTVSIDDYGSGFSSKEYIDKLNVDTIKIDGEFIERMKYDPDAMQFISQTVKDAKERGLSVIAERVETKDELEILTHLGVDKGQGYLFGKAEKIPMRQSELDLFFDKEKKIIDDSSVSLSM